MSKTVKIENISTIYNVGMTRAMLNQINNG